jgi:hypothetical protein
MSDLYRIYRGKKKETLSATFSQGEKVYFETLESAIEALTEWHFELVWKKKRGFAYRLLQNWRNFDSSKYLTDQKVKMERRVGAYWVPVEYSFTNPTVTLTTEPYEPETFEIDLTTPTRR